ncbi:expressed unknown protein [Seminavis robusta]|uniref:Uncharacterized protein n=1 Tax=Seminavis robusta TaxID=568900 RepID=A0A9N8E587_9STRA|nr:expressed unknown protein [Seminavis robusta]|eukprot:Sro631_g178510.1 n/a (412) ;mRNA; f:28927-30162
MIPKPTEDDIPKRRNSFADLFFGPRDNLGLSGSDSSDEHHAVVSALEQGRRRSSFPNLFGNNNETNTVRDTYSFSTDNQFPTRTNDLRYVDQRVNYMDVEAANYDEPSDSSDYTASDTSAEAYLEGRRFRPPRNGSIGLIQEGLNALRSGRLPRSGSLPSLTGGSSKASRQEERKQQEKRKSHSMSFLTDMDDSECDQRRISIMEVEKGVPLAPPRIWSKGGACCTHFWRLYWKRIAVLIFLVTATVLLTWLHVELLFKPFVRLVTGNSGRTAIVVPVPAKPTVNEWHTHAPVSAQPSTGVYAINRRRLVLEDVIEQRLLPQHPDDPHLNLIHPVARKAMAWMTANDVKSMKLLDQYHFHHHKREPVQVNKHVTMNVDGIKQSDQILERYIRAVSYFRDHPDADVKNTFIY